MEALIGLVFDSPSEGRDRRRIVPHVLICRAAALALTLIEPLPRLFESLRECQGSFRTKRGEYPSDQMSLAIPRVHALYLAGRRIVDPGSPLSLSRRTLASVLPLHRSASLHNFLWVLVNVQLTATGSGQDTLHTHRTRTRERRVVMSPRISRGIGEGRLRINRPASPAGQLTRSLEHRSLATRRLNLTPCQRTW